MHRSTTHPAGAHKEHPGFLSPSNANRTSIGIRKFRNHGFAGILQTVDTGPLELPVTVIQDVTPIELTAMEWQRRAKTGRQASASAHPLWQITKAFSWLTRVGRQRDLLAAHFFAPVTRTEV